MKSKFVVEADDTQVPTVEHQDVVGGQATGAICFVRPMVHRFIVAIDVDGAEDAVQAYLAIYKAMALASTQQGISWESTDEAYGPDGEEISPDELISICDKAFDLMRHR